MKYDIKHKRVDGEIKCSAFRMQLNLNAYQRKKDYCK